MEGMNTDTYLEIAKFARELRINAVKMTHNGNSSHVGSVLSVADILAVLYSHILKINPQKPNLKDRDRFILSKGHAWGSVYSALAELGFFNKSELLQHCRNGSNLSGHISHRNIPGVEFQQDH